MSFFTFEVVTTPSTSENVEDLVDINITTGFHIEAFSNNELGLSDVRQRTSTERYTKKFDENAAARSYLKCNRSINT